MCSSTALSHVLASSAVPVAPPRRTVHSLSVRKQMSAIRVWQRSVTGSEDIPPPHFLACNRWRQATLSSVEDSGSVMSCGFRCGWPVSALWEARLSYLVHQVRGFAVHPRTVGSKSPPAWGCLRLSMAPGRCTVEGESGFRALSSQIGTERYYAPSGMGDITLL